MSRRKLWSYSAGTKGNTVTVYELVPGGVIQARCGSPPVRLSLKHRNKEQAMRYAEDESARLRTTTAAPPPVPTVGYILALYVANRTPLKKTAAQRQEDERRAAMWRCVLGADTDVRTLGGSEWNAFIAKRHAGVINAHGEPTRKKNRAAVSARTVDADLVFMNSVLNWALGWKEGGQRVLTENPWGATAPGVKRALARPVDADVERPIATYDRYLTLKAVADKVLMQCRKGDAGAVLVERSTHVGAVRSARHVGSTKFWMRPSYFGELLDLAESSGRRISSICRMSANRVQRADGKIVKVKWPPLKTENEEWLSVSDATAAQLEHIIRTRRIVGRAFLFPAPKNPTKPMSRHLADDWAREAEQIAGLDHQPRGMWHPWRRKWHTERKHHPDADVLKASGRKDVRSLKTSYQLADDLSMRAVLNEPRKLRDGSVGQ